MKRVFLAAAAFVLLFAAICIVPRARVGVSELLRHQALERSLPRESLRLIYEISADFVANLELDPLGSPLPSKRRLEQSLRGTLEKTILKSGAEGVESFIRWNPAEGSTTGFLFSEKATGQAGSLIFSDHTPTLTRQLMRSLVVHTQIVFPEERLVPLAWVSHEEGVDGTFSARYEILWSRPWNRILNLRKGDLASPAASQDIVDPLDENHEGAIQSEGRCDSRYDLDAGHPLSTHVELRTKKSLGTKRVGEEFVRISMRLVKASTITDDVVENAAQEKGKILSRPHQPMPVENQSEALEDSMARNTLGNDSFDSVSARIFGSGNARFTELMQDYLKLKAALRLEPRRALDLVGPMRTLSADAGAFLAYTTALADVGTDEAQEALMAAMEGADSKKESILAAKLADVRTPNTASEARLRSIANDSPNPDVVATATLGLGTMAHHLSSHDISRSDALALELSERLATAEGAAETEIYMLALGNSGHPSTLATIDPFLKGADAHARATAAHGLRFVPGNTARQWLIRLAARDAAEEVRVAAAEALFYRAPSDDLLELWKSALEKERSGRVVRRILANLGETAKSLPEAASILRDYLAHCGTPDLCRAAESALQAF